MTTPHERAIHFSGPPADAMIRATLAGTKTVHHWPVVPQPTGRVNVLGYIAEGMESADDGLVWIEFGEWGKDSEHEVRCPYRVGDLLWWQEAWAQPYRRTEKLNGCVYKADDDGMHLNPGAMDGKWRPAIQMPRWAARPGFTRRVIGVGARLVREITFADCLAEGCDKSYVEIVPRCPDEPDCNGKHYGESWDFKRRWESTYGKQYPYDTAWAWRIEWEEVTV